MRLIVCRGSSRVTAAITQDPCAAQGLGWLNPCISVRCRHCVAFAGECCEEQPLALILCTPALLPFYLV